MDLRNIKKRIGRLAGDYLAYNRTEQRGILVLSLILLCVIIANTVFPSGSLQKVPDSSEFSKEIRSFEAEWQKAADSDSMVHSRKYLNYRNNYHIFLHDSGTYKAKPGKPLLMIELNSADTLDLQQLRGIGPGFARRIVSYRERLGGFSDKRQILEVFGMDTARYGLIEKNLHVNPDSIHPIELNHVTFKELLRHPYFPFPATKNIMVYRQKNKAFKSLDELKNIQGINDSIFRKMVIYLRLGP